MNISYDWYRVFYHVVKMGNITNAAESLFISQPAVSQIIKQLEKSIGCKLLSRNPKGVRLTAEGEVLYQHISRGVEHFLAGEKHLYSQLNMESGEINIGASDMTLEFFLLPILERFRLNYPKIKIKITNGPTPETIRILENEKIDFGVISEPITKSRVKRGFSVIPAREIEDIFICGRELHERLKDNVELKDIAEMPLIMLEENTSTRKHIDLFFRENNICVSPEIELATSRLIVQFVKRNLGIGCVVKDFARADMEKGTIYEIKTARKIPKRNICIIKRHTQCSKASELLLKMLLA